MVISGEVEAVSTAGEMLRAAGARRVVPLNVSGAFHSHLMESARQELEEMLGNYQEFTGRATEQTEEFLQEIVEPRLSKYKDLLGDYDTSLSV